MKNRIAPWLMPVTLVLLLPVFAGAAGPYGFSLDLTTLDGENGFVVTPTQFAMMSATALAGSGDFNDDGFDDVLIGDPDAFAGFQFDSGEIAVIFGAPDVGGAGVLPAPSLDGSNGFLIRGVDRFDHCGSSVSSAGDINGDGIDDIFIGARGAGAFSPPEEGLANAGRCFVVFGVNTLGSSGEFDLSTINGVNGFAIYGFTENDGSGEAVAGLGDVNADGFDDLLIGASRAIRDDLSSVGESYVVFGGPGVGSSGPIDLAALDGTDGFIFECSERSGRCGDTVSGVGDVNGDGVNDLLISSVSADGAYLIFGQVGLGAGGTMTSDSLNGANGFTIEGIDAFDRCGSAVSAAGDVNGDGCDDLLIGAVGGGIPDEFQGACYVVFGNELIGASGVFSLAALDGINGFTLTGFHEHGDFGSTVASAGDTNGDGNDDLILGFTHDNETRIVFGRANCPGDVNSDRLVDTADLGILINAFASPDTTADINGDGVVDTADLGILIAAFGDSCD